MRSSFPRVFLGMVLASTLALLATASAQEQRTETGAVVAVVDGVEQTTFTYVIAAAVDGVLTEAHSATFTFFDAFKMGDVVLVPAYVAVSIMAYDIELEDSFKGAWELNFQLDPETLELLDSEEDRLIYHPEGLNPELLYVFTQGELRLDPVAVIDDTTWRLSGSFEGQVSRQDSYEPEHNPDDSLDVAVSFRIERVVLQESPF